MQELKFCTDCGYTFKNNHWNAKRCAPCRNKVNQGREARTPKPLCDYCSNTISRRSTTGMCGFHRMRWIQSVPMAKSAASHRIVQLAVNSGILPKLDGSIPCMDCGGIAKEYDHRDYMKPLDVDPVCSSCNKQRGAALNNTKPRGGDRVFNELYKKERSYTGKPIKVK